MEAERVAEQVMSEILSPLYGLVVGVAVVYFLYGAVMFIVELRNPEKKNNGKQHLLWGLVGLFIILSVGGLLKFLNELFNGMFQF